MPQFIERAVNASSLMAKRVTRVSAKVPAIERAGCSGVLQQQEGRGGEPTDFKASADKARRIGIVDE